MIRIIAIEREFGCGESALVETLAARLGWKLLDQSLTEEVARIAQVARTVVEQREGRLDPLFYRLAKVFWHGCYEKGIPVRGHETFDADRALALVQQVVNQAATEGNCVIVGRGSAYFLRERTDTLRVFLFAPREFKFRFLLSHTQNEGKANELLDTVDYNRKMFVKHYFGAEWPLRSAYHAMLNAALGDDLVLTTILNLMDALNKKDTPS
jgi:cytidylate kinase